VMKKKKKLEKKKLIIIIIKISCGGFVWYYYITRITNALNLKSEFIHRFFVYEHGKGEPTCRQAETRAVTWQPRTSKKGILLKCCFFLSRLFRSTNKTILVLARPHDSSWSENYSFSHGLWDSWNKFTKRTELLLVVPSGGERSRYNTTHSEPWMGFFLDDKFWIYF
jgi:hypothetical protein